MTKQLNITYSNLLEQARKNLMGVVLKVGNDPKTNGANIMNRANKYIKTINNALNGVVDKEKLVVKYRQYGTGKKILYHMAISHGGTNIFLSPESIFDNADRKIKDKFLYAFVGLAKILRKYGV